MTGISGIIKSVPEKFLQEFQLKLPLLILLAFAASGIITKFFGFQGVLLFIPASIIYLKVLSFENSFVKILGKVNFITLSAVLLLIMFLLFMVIYPAINDPSHLNGSDSDDALNIAAGRILQGQYPYYEKTYLNNSITPLPGAIFLAMPFVIVFGNSAFQNFFWLGLLFLLVNRYYKDRSGKSILLITTFFFFPLIPYNIIIGSDYISNSIYVLLACAVFCNYCLNHPDSKFTPLFALIFGFSLSSRPIYLLLIPVLFVFLFRKQGWEKSVKYFTLIIIAFTSVTLPFYLFDPSGFSPLHVSYKLDRFNDILPHSEIIIPIFSILAGIIWAFFAGKTYDLDIFLLISAFTLFIPVFAGTVLLSIKAESFDPAYTYYSSLFIFFALSPLLNLFYVRNGRIKTNE